MLELEKSLPPSQPAPKAYALFEKFRPEIPPGKKGWGTSRKLHLDLNLTTFPHQFATQLPLGAN